MLRYVPLIACICSFSGATSPNTVTSKNEAAGWMFMNDRNGDRLLDREEFHLLCDELFRDETRSATHIHKLPIQNKDEIFEIFDRNADGFIEYPEFLFCYENWIETIVRPRSAFLVIDVQNDFILGTLDIRRSPAKENGEDVINPINKLLDTVPFNSIYHSLDWHPENHVSFIENVHKRKIDASSNITAANAKMFDTVVFEGPPKTEQRLWPKHCVQNTWGAELHKDLKILCNARRIYKGRNPDVDSYSVFWDNNKLSKTELHSLLVNESITDVYVSGLAYDVCVGASAMDALTLGYRVILIEDCARGVDPAGIAATRTSVVNNHGVIVRSNQVKAMVEGLDRRPNLGYKLALEVKKKLAQG